MVTVTIGCDLPFQLCRRNLIIIQYPSCRDGSGLSLIHLKLDSQLEWVFQGRAVARRGVPSRLLKMTTPRHQSDSTCLRNQAWLTLMEKSCSMSSPISPSKSCRALPWPHVVSPHTSSTSASQLMRCPLSSQACSRQLPVPRRRSKKLKVLPPLLALTPPLLD